MQIDNTCLYAKTHEWIRVDGDTAHVGISDEAQEQLTDVVYVELPDEGDTFDQGAAFAVVESVKAASDVLLPVAGEIIEVNSALDDDPAIINTDPYGDAWFVKIRVTEKSQLDGLLTPEAYNQFLEEGGED